jgi:DNA-directed RNA polymerase specialized sigma24 family protein
VDSESTDRPDTPSTEEVPWEDLVEWAERDLRRRLDAGLLRGGPVSPTSVLHSTLRRAAQREDRVGSSLGRAKAFLSGIAKRVRSEKLRRERAQRRRPTSGVVLPMGEHQATVEDPETPNEDVWEAVDQLSAEDAELLRAVYRDRRSLADFARRSGLKAGQVEERHKRALESLRRLMGGDQ